MLTLQDTVAIRRIESAIGYTFRDKRLLVQVFTRKTYMKIDPEAPDNEVLEFYGDMLMSYHVTTYFVEKFAHMLDDGLYFMRTVEQFTEMRSHYVRNQYLTERIKQLIPNIDHLVRAQNPRVELPKDNQKAYADLFESLIGAVYLDSYQDEKLIRSFILGHLNIEPKVKDTKSQAPRRSSNTVVLPSVSLVYDDESDRESENEDDLSASNVTPDSVAMHAPASNRDDADGAAAHERDALLPTALPEGEAPARAHASTRPSPASSPAQSTVQGTVQGTASPQRRTSGKTPKSAPTPTPVAAPADTSNESSTPAPAAIAPPVATSTVKENAASAEVAPTEIAPAELPPAETAVPAAVSDATAPVDAVPVEVTATETVTANQDALAAFCREVGYEPPVYGEPPKNAPNARPVAACTVRFRNRRGKPVKISLNDSGKTLAEATEKAAFKMLKKLKEQLEVEAAQAPRAPEPTVPAPTPAVETPAVEAPVVEASVVEAPVVEAPVVEAPVAEAPVAEAPVAESPVVEAPVAESPVVEAPVVEAPVVEAPVAESPVVEAPVAESPVVEAPVVEAPVAEKPAGRRRKASDKATSPAEKASTAKRSTKKSAEDTGETEASFTDKKPAVKKGARKSVPASAEGEIPAMSIAEVTVAEATSSETSVAETPAVETSAAKSPAKPRRRAASKSVDKTVETAAEGGHPEE